MTRIIAGVAGGLRLAAPAGLRTRPTSGRAREGFFSSLQSLADLEGASFLDLYAGTGAVGLEALSRGAARALLVECDGRALAELRANVRRVGLNGAEVRADRVERLVSRPAPEAFDVVFADPPYAEDVTPVLADLVTHSWAAGLVVLERASRNRELHWPPGLQPVYARRYGEATLWYGRRS